jgi:hypothetical protein
LIIEKFTDVLTVILPPQFAHGKPSVAHFSFGINFIFLPAICGNPSGMGILGDRPSATNQYIISSTRLKSLPFMCIGSDPGELFENSFDEQGRFISMAIGEIPGTNPGIPFNCGD